MSAKSTGTVTRRLEVHHRIPRYLLSLYDRANETGDGALWVELEEELSRYGLPTGITREDLERVVEGSVVELSWSDHRYGEHASDWARWGRLGGLATYSRYGRDWYSLLSRYRWRQIRAEILAEYRAMSTYGKEA